MSDIDQHLPHITVKHNGEIHVLNVRVLRAIRDGHYLGDAVNVSRVLAVAVLDHIEMGIDK